MPGTVHLRTLQTPTNQWVATHYSFQPRERMRIFSGMEKAGQSCLGDPKGFGGRF
jgi:hypothetical protein